MHHLGHLGGFAFHGNGGFFLVVVLFLLVVAAVRS